MSTAIAFRTIFDPAAIPAARRPFGVGIVSPISAATRVFVKDGHARGIWTRDTASGVWTFADRPTRTLAGPVIEAWYRRGAVEILAQPQKGRSSINEAFEAGRTAAMADAAPVPPAAWSDDLKGAWLDGYAEGDEIVAARETDWLMERAEIEELERASVWA